MNGFGKDGDRAGYQTNDEFKSDKEGIGDHRQLRGGDFLPAQCCRVGDGFNATTAAHIAR